MNSIPGFLLRPDPAKGYRRGFSLTEILIALAIVAVIAVLVIPVITTRAQNRSLALSYETEVKQMMASLEGLPSNENKDDISQTMMYVNEEPTSGYGIHQVHILINI